MLLGDRRLGQFEQRRHIGHKLHGFVDRKELDGVVQKEEIRLMVRVPFYLLCPLAVSKIIDDMGTNRYRP